VKRAGIRGVAIDPLTRDELQSRVREAIAGGSRQIIANHNAHSVYLFHHDQAMRTFYARADVVHVDGMALVFVAKLLGLGWRREQRVTYVDWLPALLSEAAGRWRIFYVGSQADVVARGVETLRVRYPGLEIGYHHGYFDMAADGYANEQVLDEVRRFQPDILMVGMGMPRQEHWILENQAKLEAIVVLTAGACMDYVAGAIPTPPRWTGRLGVEWLYRLAAEPSRLWKRYLLEPWFLLVLLAGEMTRRALGRGRIGQARNQ
jgi:N-acetylglucosaminyldiphosphoundecaprenol N-acetyl-beta-D-mannosaminyltransferase